MRHKAFAALLALVLAGCSSSVAGQSDTGSPTAASSASVPASESAAPVTSAPAPSPTRHVTTNADVCDQVQNYMVDHVQRTFHSWKPDVNEFNKKVGRQLRTEATHLYSLAAHATGAVAQSIRGEARGLTKISIAIEEENDNAIGSAANAANTSLADLRGTCNF